MTRAHDNGPGLRFQVRRRNILLAVAVVLSTGNAIVAPVSFRANAQRAREARQLAIRIQQERTASISEGCQQQNSRHDATIAALDALLARASRDANSARREQLKQSRRSTVLLIDSLAPKQNCEALVKSRVATSSP